MFNPKGNNLLDQQLTVSGLEMNWGFAAVAAIGSIAGGIMGSRQASSSNAAARKAQKQQEEHNKKVAKLTNEHNAKLDAAELANYKATYKYSYETKIRDWERGKEIQDYQYLQRLKQYQKSTAIGIEQLGLNAEAAAQGIQAEQDAINEAFIKQQFQHRQSKDALKQVYVEQNINRQEQFQKIQGIRSRQAFGAVGFQNSINELMTQSALAKESSMVKNLIAEGSVQAAGQAGKSTAKAMQSNMAELHRGLMALDSELSGKYKQAAVKLAELNADASLQEAGVGLNLQRIDNAIKDAEETAKFNLDVMRENMKSTIAETVRNVEQIGLERRVSDVNTRANMMLFPERLSYDPRPEKPPERIFVERMKAIPGFVPPAQQQSTWAPIVSGVTSGASALAGADFNNNFFGQ
jgi:hypothetical protein